MQLVGLVATIKQISVPAQNLLKKMLLNNCEVLCCDIICCGYTVGWVNFSEFKNTVCGSCKMLKRT